MKGLAIRRWEGTDEREAATEEESTKGHQRARKRKGVAKGEVEVSSLWSISWLLPLEKEKGNHEKGEIDESRKAANVAAVYDRRTLSEEEPPAVIDRRYRMGVPKNIRRRRRFSRPSGRLLFILIFVFIFC